METTPSLSRAPEPADPMLERFIEELSLLEQEMASFSEAFPEAARELGLGMAGCSDPHVRMLVEAVAFISMRLRRQFEAATGEVSLAVLEALAPALTECTPSMGVAVLRPGPKAQKTVLAAGTRFGAEAGARRVGFSMLGRELTLWPLAMRAAWTQPTPESRRRLELKFEPVGGGTFALGRADALTLFVGGPQEAALRGTQALLLSTRELQLASRDGSWSVPLSAHSLRLRECVGDPSDASVSACQALNWPRTNCFMEFAGMPATPVVDGLILSATIDEAVEGDVDAVLPHLHLNCVPVVNRYVAAPFAIDLSKASTPTLRLSRVGTAPWDVVSISRVGLLVAGRHMEVPPFNRQTAGSWMWAPQRFARFRRTDAVASVGVQLLDALQRPALPAQATAAVVHAEVTDCDLAHQLAAGAALNCDGVADYPATLYGPCTPFIDAPDAAQGSTAALMSALAWRAAAPDAEEELARRVQGFLRMHLRTPDVALQAAIESIQSVSRKPVVRLLQGHHGVRGQALGWHYEFRYGRTASTLPQYFVSRLVARALRAHVGIFGMEASFAHCCSRTGAIHVV